MLILVACPEPGCDAPAEVTDQFVLWSTSGPVAHVRTYCLHRHILTLPVRRLDATVDDATIDDTTVGDATIGRPPQSAA